MFEEVRGKSFVITVYDEGTYLENQNLVPPCTAVFCNNNELEDLILGLLEIFFKKFDSKKIALLFNKICKLYLKKLKELRGKDP